MSDLISRDVPIDEIIIDERYQQREDLYSTATVDRYADLMRDGVVFPPIILFTPDDDSEDLFLVDGFQRVHAAKKAGLDSLPSERHTGTPRDALLFSTSANAAHGLQPSSADKRKAVTLLIQDEEWSQWSDRQIARHAGVSNKLVSRVRRELVHSGGVEERTEIKVVRAGKVHTAKVSYGQDDTKQFRVIERLIEQVGDVDSLVMILVEKYGASVTGNTSNQSVYGNTSGGES